MDWSDIPHTKEVLKNQCIFAHTRFDKVDFDSKTWFRSIEWNEEQETAFKNWLYLYLKYTPKARKELCLSYRPSKKYFEKWFVWWNLMYGFKRNDLEYLQEKKD